MSDSFRDRIALERTPMVPTLRRGFGAQTALTLLRQYTKENSTWNRGRHRTLAVIWHRRSRYSACGRDMRAKASIARPSRPLAYWC